MHLARWVALATAGAVGVLGVYLYFGVYGGTVLLAAAPVFVSVVLIWSVGSRNFHVGWASVLALGAGAIALLPGVGGGWLPLAVVGALGFGAFHWTVRTEASDAATEP